MVTGQAGAGKSRVVNVLRDDCRQRGHKVVVICSSGIACQVYDRGVACTVHSCYGLGAAHMPSGQLMDRATSNAGVSEKLKTVDVVIWDEASMSSARMLELVNALHHRLCEDESEEESFPFAENKLLSLVSFYSFAPYRAHSIRVPLCSFHECLDTPLPIDFNSPRCCINRIP